VPANERYVKLEPMKFAYADPPYLGCCKLYDHHHPDGRCWDDLSTHVALIERLACEFPDGWALSCTSGSLRHLLPHCPADVRVGPWVKTFGAFKRGVRPAWMWEPVIFRGGRNPSNGHAHKPPEKNGKQTTPEDFAIVEDGGSLLAEPITLKKGLTGAKPEAFCEWVLDLLNVQPGDEVVDLFPGTGIMSRVAAARGALPAIDFEAAA
jgi:hypothetical protein